MRPHRSVSLLQGIISTAMISRNSVIVVCTPFTSVCRSWLMSLIITFMFEPAKLQMNWASASGAMNARGDLTHDAVPEACSDGVALMPCLARPAERRRRHSTAGSRASWSFCASASESVVLITVPPCCFSAAIALSGSACSIAKNSAEVPGCRCSRTWRWKSSPMPFSFRKPSRAPTPAPTAHPASGRRNRVPNSRPQNPPQIAPPAIGMPSSEV